MTVGHPRSQLDVCVGRRRGAEGQNLTLVYRYADGYYERLSALARPADLPIEQPTKVQLAINLKAAKALGLTIPQTLLLQADQLILPTERAGVDRVTKDLRFRSTRLPS